MRPLLLLCLFLSRGVFATAGFAETYRFHEFTHGVALVLGHGDACMEAPGKNCLFLQSSKGKVHAFQLAVPEGRQDAHALIQDEGQAVWQILELPSLVPVFESKDREAAFLRWREMGKPEPRLVGYADASTHFKETADSIERNRPLLDFGFFALLGSAFLVGGALVGVAVRRRRKPRPGRVSGS